jgi:hypothetical protein
LEVRGRRAGGRRPRHDGRVGGGRGVRVVAGGRWVAGAQVRSGDGHAGRGGADLSQVRERERERERDRGARCFFR